jgi:hypothetical protein
VPAYHVSGFVTRNDSAVFVGELISGDLLHLPKALQDVLGSQSNLFLGRTGRTSSLGLALVLLPELELVGQGLGPALDCGSLVATTVLMRSVLEALV